MTFHDARALLAADLSRNTPVGRFRACKYLFSRNPSKRSVARLRIADFLHSSGYRKLAEFLLSDLKTGLGVHIGVTAQVGAGLKLPHATSVVIGHGIVVGSNC